MMALWRFESDRTTQRTTSARKPDDRLSSNPMGAGYSNGYAVKLPNVLPANVSIYNPDSKWCGGCSYHSQEGDNWTIRVIWILGVDLDNLGELSESCVFYRTQSTCSDQQNADVCNFYQLYAWVYDSPAFLVMTLAIRASSFIFCRWWNLSRWLCWNATGHDWQTHLKAFSGTSDADNTLFNSHDDSSSGSRSLEIANNMPWVINIRDRWDHPVGWLISVKLTSFPTWVTSSERNRQRMVQSIDHQ